MSLIPGEVGDCPLVLALVARSVRAAEKISRMTTNELSACPTYQQYSGRQAIDNVADPAPISRSCSPFSAVQCCQATPSGVKAATCFDVRFGELAFDGALCYSWQTGSLLDLVSSLELRDLARISTKLGVHSPFAPSDDWST